MGKLRVRGEIITLNSFIDLDKGEVWNMVVMFLQVSPSTCCLVKSVRTCNKPDNTLHRRFAVRLKLYVFSELC